MTKPKKPDNAPDEIESNHNAPGGAKPVQTAQLRNVSDYNPMRREGGKANVASDTTMNADDNAALVEEKGDRPSPGDAPVIEE